MPMNGEKFIRLTVTLDVFKFFSDNYFFNLSTWLTVTLDVFKFISLFVYVK